MSTKEYELTAQARKQSIRGAVKIKNVTKLWKKSKRGRGSALKIKKSTIQNVDYFETRGGSEFCKAQGSPSCAEL